MTTTTIHKRSIAVKHKHGSMRKKAIGFLEAQLPGANAERSDQIRSAIHTFRANLERGVPWPGKSATQS